MDIQKCFCCNAVPTKKTTSQVIPLFHKEQCMSNANISVINCNRKHPPAVDTRMWWTKEVFGKTTCRTSTLMWWTKEVFSKTPCSTSTLMLWTKEVFSKTPCTDYPPWCERKCSIKHLAEHPPGCDGQRKCSVKHLAEHPPWSTQPLQPTNTLTITRRSSSLLPPCLHPLPHHFLFT